MQININNSKLLPLSNMELRNVCIRKNIKVGWTRKGVFKKCAAKHEHVGKNEWVMNEYGLNKKSVCAVQKKNTDVVCHRRNKSLISQEIYEGRVNRSKGRERQINFWLDGVNETLKIRQATYEAKYTIDMEDRTFFIQGCCYKLDSAVFILYLNFFGLLFLTPFLYFRCLFSWRE